MPINGNNLVFEPLFKLECSNVIACDVLYTLLSTWDRDIDKLTTNKIENARVILCHFVSVNIICKVNMAIQHLLYYYIIVFSIVKHNNISPRVHSLTGSGYPFIRLYIFLY